MIVPLHMVDIGDKPKTRRMALAEGFVRLEQATVRAIRQGELPKGDVLTCAKVAGVAAAKRTPELLPLCHNIALSWVAVECTVLEDRVRIEATVTAQEATGVEMEALSAVSVAALTIYDMCKSIDPGMRIEGIRLLRKRGGRHDFDATSDASPAGDGADR